MNVEYTSSEAPTAIESDQKSSVHARSTLAQTLISRANQDNLYNSDNTCEVTVENRQVEPSGLAALSISSREYIRKYFGETRPINHPTIALTQD